MSQVNHSTLTEAQIRRGVKVRRSYDVVCELETCNGMQDELLGTLQEAKEAREQHIQLHLDGQFAGEEDGSVFW